MELTMFERMLQLPLLQGLTPQEMSEVMAHVRLDFVNYQSGDEIAMQDAPCRNLIYVINGELMEEYRDPQYRFTLKEDLPQVKVIEPYNMFGMFQKYSRTYLFKTDGITLNIDKQVMLTRLMANTIVKINLLNITCNRYQLFDEEIVLRHKAYQVFGPRLADVVTIDGNGAFLGFHASVEQGKQGRLSCS